VPKWFDSMGKLGQLALAGDEDAIRELTRYATRSNAQSGPEEQNIDAAATYYLLKATGKTPDELADQGDQNLPPGLDLSRFQNAR
jgi:hypothetical protein